MIKIIKIEYFDQFQCLMERCPDNCCCERWSISIDESTYNKYVNMNISDLDKKIKSTKPHTIIKHMGKCPFITENGLCSIQKEYGEEFLSNTCRAYPRFVSEHGDLFIENIGLSCPAVVELFYERNSIADSIAECYSMFGVNEALTMSLEFSKNYSLLLQNISICYLFERIMLQSKKQNPDYISVIERLCFILKQFEERCQKVYGDCEVYTTKQLSTALYQTMRDYDHEI